MRFDIVCWPRKHDDHLLGVLISPPRTDDRLDDLRKLVTTDCQGIRLAAGLADEAVGFANLSGGVEQVMKAISPETNLGSALATAVEITAKVAAARKVAFILVPAPPLPKAEA
jgi:hypothetical protein